MSDITESEAVVVAVDGDRAWLEANTRSSCSGCSANQSCGTSVLSQVLGKRISRIEVSNSLDVAIGDKVVVAMNDGAIRRGTLLIYGLPLILLLAGSALFSWLWNGAEVAQILGAVFGLFSGLVLASTRLRQQTSRHEFQPILIRKLQNYGVLNEIKFPVS